MSAKPNGMVLINDTDGFKNFLLELSGGKTLKQLSVAMGLGDTYLTNATKRNRISLVAVKALCAELGVTEKVLIERIQREPEAPKQKEPERKPEPVAGADLKTLIELVETQNKMIASIGKILTNMESIMETSWK